MSKLKKIICDPFGFFEKLDAGLAESSLREFMRQLWSTVEPGEFKDNWHIDAICDHLTAIVDRQIPRGLLINIPPRHTKSLVSNVFLPAWVWAQDPNLDGNNPYSVRPDCWRGPGVKFMYLSYDRELAKRDSRKCRDLMRSARYRRNWTDYAPEERFRFVIRPESDNNFRFDTDKGGFRFATSERGLVTGEGADIIVFDDPHNVRDADSDTVREATLRFFDEALSTRLNDPKYGVIIVIAQRVHERDLSGHILAKEMGWTHLCLPAEYERHHPYPLISSVPRQTMPKPNQPLIGPQKGEPWRDARTREGDPLWPEKFPKEELKRWAATMGAHAAAGQLQQRPSLRAGGLFKRDWFSTVRFIPEAATQNQVRAWDLASTSDTSADPDWTVGVLLCRDPSTGIFYVADVIRQRWSPAQLELGLLATAEHDGRRCRIKIPQDPGGAGKFQASHLVKRLAGFTVDTERENTSKENRADPFASQCEQGLVKLLDAAWNQPFIDELCAFPMGSHDDQVDAVSAAFRAMFKRKRFTRSLPGGMVRGRSCSTRMNIGRCTAWTEGAVSALAPPTRRLPAAGGAAVLRFPVRVRTFPVHRASSALSPDEISRLVS